MSTAQAPVRRLFALLMAERGEIGFVYVYAMLSGLRGLALPVGVQAIIGRVAGGLLLQPVVILIAAVVLGTTLAGAVQLSCNSPRWSGCSTASLRILHSIGEPGFPNRIRMPREQNIFRKR